MKCPEKVFTVNPCAWCDYAVFSQGLRLDSTEQEGSQESELDINYMLLGIFTLPDVRSGTLTATLSYCFAGY